MADTTRDILEAVQKRLAELEGQVQQQAPTKAGLESNVRRRDKGVHTGHRKCLNDECNVFLEPQEIKLHGYEDVVMARDMQGNVTETVSNSYHRWELVNENDDVCPECQTTVGFVAPDAVPVAGLKSDEKTRYKRLQRALDLGGSDQAAELSKIAEALKEATNG
jgi:hypothetical protein